MSNHEAMTQVVEEIKATYGKDWHTAVVYELMRLHAVVNASLHSNGDLQRYHLLRRFVCNQLKLLEAITTAEATVARLEGEDNGRK